MCPKSHTSSPRAGWFLLCSSRQCGRQGTDCHGLASPTGNFLLLFSACLLAFFPVSGAGLRYQQHKRNTWASLLLLPPICFCSCALVPSEKGKGWRKTSIFYMFSALTFATCCFGSFPCIMWISYQHSVSTVVALPQTHRHPPPTSN